MKKIKRRYGKNHKNILVTHIQNNIREYTIGCIIFVIGVLLGVVFVNNLTEIQTDEISVYITESITSLKHNTILNKLEILKESIKNDIILVIFLWLMGSTVIGLLLVYLIVCFKGFCFGYTLSTIIFVLGLGKGTLFLISTILLKNIIAIPCTIALAVSGMKLYKSIMHDRRKENIKLEVFRHTSFSFFVLILLIIASFIEVYISNILLKYCIKYI